MPKVKLKYPFDKIKTLESEQDGGLIIETAEIKTPAGETFTSNFAFDANTGFYLGDPEFARKLTNKFQISVFFLSSEKRAVATVGYSEAQTMCYGWSSSKICGFRIGDKIYDAEFEEDTSPEKHGSDVIKSREDCIQAAINFSEHMTLIEIAERESKLN